MIKPHNCQILKISFYKIYNEMSNDIIWLERPLNLITSLRLFPSKNSTFDQKVNALTRLLIVISIILAVMKWKHWYLILIVGLPLIVQVYLSRDSNPKVKNDYNEYFINKGRKMAEKNDVSVESLYTKICIPDKSNPSVMNIRDVRDIKPQNHQQSEIKIIPKVVKSTKNVKRCIENNDNDNEIRLRGFGKNKSQPKAKSMSGSDMMRDTYREFNDAERAEIDIKNMSSMLN